MAIIWPVNLDFLLLLANFATEHGMILPFHILLVLQILDLTLVRPVSE